MTEEQPVDLRVLRTEVVDIRRLNLYHRNPRKGDVDAVAESLRVNGLFRAVIVNTGDQTGRRDEVLAGNHTVQAARKLGWSTILVSFVDYDDAAAARVVLADNRTSDLADYDKDTLLAVLQEAPDLEGTGYTTDDLDDLASELLDEGAPGSADLLEPGDDEYNQQFGVTVICQDEAEQQHVYEQLKAEGYDVRVVTV